ncbi:cytochrome c oxidase assembly protein subunit 15 [Paenibacillus shirakamiensis]|uniref:Cytochrome c oxidase assembly protein subunit 15 n=1 Tax=Paenibacillus shirakamiensis TaxID=1265935 RepID=A0ABS4JLU0_9BACL|nr:heme A synthase [Paenibacillus shirakamiensis]MBP2002066.1 cytochrome c oxidase assembly protein subunit 15 [Paenibacillus shirakamiensis]
MNTKQLKWLSYATSFIMLMATLGGTVVTKTDAGLGCGKEWPLCNGTFVPAHTLSSLIEYSHRAVSGAAGMVALAAFIAFMIYRKERRDLRMYATLSLIFVIIQAGMGAFAVVFSQSSAIMALHFGFSLIAFASSVMLALGMRQEDKQQHLAPLPPAAPVTKGLRNWVWFATAYTYIVVYLGAYVSHTNSAGGCSGWPLCNGALIPELSGGVTIAFIHRLGAFLLFIVIGIVGHFAYRHNPYNKEIRSLGVWATVLVLIQILTGGFLVFNLYNPRMYIFASLAHIFVLATLFGVLCYMSVRTWQLSRSAVREERMTKHV